MELTEKFKIYLLSQKKKSSALTIKNYIADVKQFIFWIEDINKQSFTPGLITEQTLNYFRETKKNTLSASSLDRHLASLKKFWKFLLTDGITEKNPFHVAKPVAPMDLWHFREFKDFLYTHNASSLTTKNYLIDLRQFLGWTDKLNLNQNKNTLDHLNLQLIQEYKNRIIQEKVFSYSSINRKLSAIRKYLSWLIDQKYISPQEFKITSVTSPSFTTELKLHQNTNQLEKVDQPIVYSRIPPIRLMQKIFGLTNSLFDNVFISPLVDITKYLEYFGWTILGKPVFEKTEKPQASIQNISKAFYAPEKLSIKNFPLYKKLLHHLRFSRPNWYKQYHTYAITNYFHFSILVICMTITGTLLYQGFIQNPNKQNPVFASTSLPRILTFHGHLNDKTGNAITSTSTLHFGIYNDQDASGSALLWTETDSITPSTDGSFSVFLGTNSTIPQDIFTHNSALYLGITVGSDSELKPRQQLATNAYTADSESLQGLTPITSSTDTKNVVLALDSTGNLTIGGSATPTFQATNGQFTLSGQSLFLTTNTGSNTDVQISPDGLGKIDLQKPLQNSTNNNNLQGAEGSVEVDDTFSILATSSSQSAFTINQNDFGPLISASSSGIAKFTVDNNGNGVFAGTISVGNFASAPAPLGSGSMYYDTTNKNFFFYNGENWTRMNNPNYWVSSTGSMAAGAIFLQNVSSDFLLGGNSTASAKFSVLNLGSGTPTASISGNLTLDSAGIISTTRNRSLTLGDKNTGDIILAPNGQTVMTLTNKNMGVGTSSPNFTTSFMSNMPNSNTTAISNLSDTNTASTSALRLNLGTSINSSTPSSSFIQFFANSTTDNDGISVGSISLNNSNVAYNTGNADFAEYFPIADKVEQGDIIAISKDGNIKATKGRQLLGVISDSAGFIGNAKNKDEKVVGLIGQIKTKVSTINGEINIGDPLTASDIPGVAMKATSSVEIIGKALETYSNNDKTAVNKILVAINSSWYEPPFNPISQIGDFSKALIANLQVGVLKAEDITTNSLSITTANVTVSGVNLKDYITQIVSDTIHNQFPNLFQNQMISPVAQIENLKTNLISPLASNSAIAIKIDSDKISILNTSIDSASTAATIDNQGNASFSGQLNSNNLNVNSDATISGTLHAKKIIADDIEGLNAKIGTLSANQITNITNNYYATPSATPTPQESPILANSSNTLNNNYFDSASLSANLSFVPTLKAQFASFEQGLMSLGPTSLTDTSITGTLSIGSQFTLANNSINVLGGDLEIQPLRQGGVSFLSGEIYIDNNGNLTINKDAVINGKLSANIISPLPNKNLVIQLSNSNSTSSASESANQNLDIQDASGSAVLSINSIGDLVASGAANFSKLNLNFVSPAYAISDSEVVSTASAGMVTIKPHQSEITIDNPYVSENSLIYITPIGTPSGQTPFLLRQVANKSFTVGIEESINQNTNFNYLIIN